MWTADSGGSVKARAQPMWDAIPAPKSNIVLKTDDAAVPPLFLDVRDLGVKPDDGLDDTKEWLHFTMSDLSGNRAVLVCVGLLAVALTWAMNRLRALQEKFDEVRTAAQSATPSAVYVNVKDFGAHGDGKTDDTGAVRALGLITHGVPAPPSGPSAPSRTGLTKTLLEPLILVPGTFGSA